MTEAAIENMQEDIKSLKSEVEVLKKQMTDFEVMSPEDEALHEQGMKEYKEGKSKSWRKLKKELAY